MVELKITILALPLLTKICIQDKVDKSRRACLDYDDIIGLSGKDNKPQFDSIVAEDIAVKSTLGLGSLFVKEGGGAGSSRPRHHFFPLLCLLVNRMTGIGS